MFGIAISIFSLLLSTALLLLGIGLQGTLLGLRAVAEQFPVSVIGYVMSSYFVGFAIGTYLCPPIIRRVGHIRAYTAMAAIASSVAIAHVLIIDPLAWALFRVVTGICMVALYMIIESWLNSLAPNNLRGQFFSAYMVITFVAMALSQYLLLLSDIAGYTLFAINTIVLSVALVPISLTRVQQPTLVETPRLHLITISRESPMGVAGTLTAGVVMGGFWGMMSVYSSKIGLDTAGVAKLMSATILGGAILQWPIGKLSDHIDRRIVLGAVAFAAAIISGGGYAVPGFSQTLLYPFYFLYGGFAFSIYSLSVAHVNDRLPPEQALEASRGLLQLYGIGAVIGPGFAGLIMRWYGHETLPLLFAGTLGLLSLFTLYRINASEAPSLESHEEFIPVQRTSPVALELDPRMDLEHAEIADTVNDKEDTAANLEK
jgi:MFS family permease